MSPRSYKSELREAQTEETRRRILDALASVMAEGVETLSVPAVAERAGVSVGTIYRHFGDKAGLVRGLMPHAIQRTGTVVGPVPTSIEEMDEIFRKVFHHFESADDLIRAAFASRMGRTARIEWSEERLEIIKESLRHLKPDLTPDQLDHFAKTALILTTSDVYREWKERLGLTPDQVADEVMWVIRTLLRGLNS